jgi:hypothetical protein
MLLCKLGFGYLTTTRFAVSLSTAFVKLNFGTISVADIWTNDARVCYVYYVHSAGPSNAGAFEH